MQNNKTFVLHHSAVSRKKVWFQTWAIDRYHRQRWNMKSELGFYGGYQYTIDPAGNIVQFRKEHEEGMHTVGHNKGYVGICLQGDFRVEKPTEVQIKSLRSLIRQDDKVWLHKELQANRVCPCLSREYVEMILKDDKVETEKEKQIIQLAGRLDYLKQILLSLLEKLNL